MNYSWARNIYEAVDFTGGARLRRDFRMARGIAGG
jgi:hypothetical protein